jgi:hypothetical protein
MKPTTDRSCADPEAAARKLIEIANSVEAVQDGRIHIEKINGPFLFDHKETPAGPGSRSLLNADGSGCTRAGPT